MIIYKTVAQIVARLRPLAASKKLGFVPTMGALHSGHISLIEIAKKDSDIVVASIFVNPTQFNNHDDFTHYPITLEKDIEQLISSGCDILFLPPVSEIYPPNFIKKTYSLGKIEILLEGYFRPGHFQGVCQVVDRLLEIVAPNQIYLGQKDYQQCMVIDNMLTILGKEKLHELIICSTVRAKNGLALSSRNLRLTDEEKEKAGAIYTILVYLKEHIDEPFSSLQAQAISALQKDGFAVDYVAIADATTLEPATPSSQKLIGLVAASIGGVRLIDNMLLN